VFRAFLSGISDNHSGEYNTFRYLGRGENFRTYQGFDRTVSFSFKIFAQSRPELRPMYEKLNYLTSQVYPDYSPTTSAMRAPIIKLTIGDYLYRTPGVLESINITIEDDTSWEIASLAGEKESRAVGELPHYLNVSVTFKPIMDILPRRAQELNDIPALLANRNMIIDSEAKAQADTRVLINDGLRRINEQFLAENINEQLLRNIIENPPIIPDGTIDTDFLITTG
jgi:hypothetical protein